MVLCVLLNKTLIKKESPELLNVSRNTLTNFEREKSELARLINQGFVLDANIEAIEKHLAELKAI